MIRFKSLAQEGLALLTGFLRRGRLGAGITDLEDGLQLGAIGERMRAREHFHNQASKGPNVGFAGVRGLLDYFGGHPEHAALQAWTEDLAHNRLWG